MLSEKSKARCAKLGAAVKKRRADLPFIAGDTRQRLPGDAQVDTEALAILEKGVCTHNSRKSSSARLAWW